MQVENIYGDPKDSLDGINTATDNSSKTLKAGQGPGTRISVTLLVVDNTSAVDTHVDILDGGVQKLRIPAPRGSGAVITLSRPLRLTENSPLQFQATTGVTTLTVSFVGFKGS